MDAAAGKDLREEALPSILVKAYRLYQQIARYPELQEEIRKLFLRVLEERGVVAPGALDALAHKNAMENQQTPDEEAIQIYTNTLIDLFFARHFSQEEIDNHINLVRKKEAFQKLHEVVNREDVTSATIKRALKDFCCIPQGNLVIPPSESEGVRVALINHFISSQLPFIGVAKNHISVRDIDELIDHSYWNRRRSGKIGGKAAGMFLAYKVLLPRLLERDPELEQYVSIPESYYFNSGNLSDFLDYNRLYSFHSQKYKTSETIEEEYRGMARLFERASFPPDVIDDFRDFLEKVGPEPLILRSSSLLEDSFGYAFSGKYDSLFLANQGDLQSRLNDFMWGMKRILMSTFSPGAILYRRDHNLIDFDERMSVLVQKVVGRRFGSYFLPLVGGVAFSRSAYAWTPRIVPEEGMLRMVLGLGTRAVDQVAGDYPRMVALSHPTLRPEIGVGEIRKYSQKFVDLVNLETGGLQSVSYLDLFQEIRHPDLYYVLSSIEDELVAPLMFKTPPVNLGQSVVTFDNLLSKTPFVGLMKKVLTRLEKAYGHPVDVEFAWDDDKLFILQCRFLPMGDKVGRVELPADVPAEDILFTTHKVLSSRIVRDLDYIVYVDPRAYSKLLSYEEKLRVGGVVGKVNRLFADERYALFGPGRWGSNDINQGVKIGYEDINRTLVLGEIAFEEEGSTPEVSYGTHFFNDLIEAKILPLAIYPDQPGTVFRESLIHEAPNLLASFFPDYAQHQPVVRVVRVSSIAEGRKLQIFQDVHTQTGIGFFGLPSDEATRQGLS